MGIPTETLKAIAADPDCNDLPRRHINAGLRRGPAFRTAAGLATPRVCGLVGGDKPVSVVVPIRIVSTPNDRRHRQAAARLVRHQRNLVALWLGRVVLPAPPCRVTLTRIYAPRLRQKPYDDDNNVAGLKGCRDAVASLYGLSDAAGSPLTFAYGGQEQGETAGVRIEVSPCRA